MWDKSTLRLTLQYSVLFLGCLAIFSLGLYQWADHAFADGFVLQVERHLKAEDGTARQETIEAAANVAVTQFRDILIFTDIVAAIFIPIGSFAIARRTVKPLIESNERQKRFVANASHELRTPLAVLSGELELALKKERDKATYKQTIQSSQLEVERLTRLTNQLLELHRIETQSGSGSIQKRRLKLNLLVEAAILRHQADASQVGITLRHEAHTSSPQIIANETLISTALDNLIANAIKYSASATTVVVGIEKPAGSTIIFVENLPAKPIKGTELPKLFERFYQSGYETDKRGYGLGLAIVRSIMDSHRGKVTAHFNQKWLRFELVFKR